MDRSLDVAIRKLKEASKADTPTMFWQEAMEHVAVLLEDISQQRGVSAAASMPPEINNHLLAWIVDQIFDGAIEDDSVIRDIYRLIAADQASFSATEYARGAPASLQSVLAERIRQIQVECFYPEHDDELADESLALAAACYAMPRWFTESGINLWPWDAAQWKPGDRRTSLVKAGALILAEIDRLDRAAALAKEEQPHV